MVQLNRDEVLKLLMQADDRLQAGTPKNFDRKRLDSQFFNLAIKILHEVGWECSIHVAPPGSGKSRYATIILPLHISRVPPPREIAAYRNSIWVSHFGNFVTMDLHWPIQPEILAALMKAIEESGFTFIPLTILEERYTGEFLETLSIRTWDARFFSTRVTERPKTPAELQALRKQAEDIAYLEKSDDPGVEDPIYSDDQLEEKFLALVEKVNKELGGGCREDHCLQDSTCFGEIFLPHNTLSDKTRDPERTFHRIVVSNFGNLATIEDSDSPIQPDIRSRLEKLMTESGFHYIPESTSRFPYTGKYHKKKRFGSWHARYFSWS